MALKGKPIAVGTSDTDIYLVPSTLEASVHGLVFYNTTASSVTITVKIYTQSTGSTTTLLNAVTVATKSTYVWDKPINLASADKIIASASSGSSIVANYSVFENSSTPATTGFTPRGTWSSSANYVANDVVSASNGNSYLAIQAGSNQNPATATAYWQVLAEKGATGEVSLNGTQTLTNKTLTSPVLNTPTVAGMLINDGFTEEVYSADSGSAITLDLANGGVQEITLTANTTITMPTASTGKSFTLSAKQDTTGSRTITWSTVNWSSATAPTLTTTASYKDIFQFLAIGTTWYGWVVSQNHA